MFCQQRLARDIGKDRYIDRYRYIDTLASVSLFLFAVAKNLST